LAEVGSFPFLVFLLAVRNFDYLVFVFDGKFFEREVDEWMNELNDSEVVLDSKPIPWKKFTASFNLSFFSESPFTTKHILALQTSISRLIAMTWSLQLLSVSCDR
jgi:hypothetical protein